MQIQRPYTVMPRNTRAHTLISNLPKLRSAGVSDIYETVVSIKSGCVK